MARIARRVFAGLPHLVVQHAGTGETAFRVDADRLDYLSALRESGLYESVTLQAYALLEATVLLLVTPGDASDLGAFMQRVNRRFVPAVHRRHGLHGLLWHGRFRSAVVDPEHYLHAATLWIEQSALRTGLAADAIDWPWSSARHHAGGEGSRLIRESPYWWRLGNTPFEREARHRQSLHERLCSAEVETFESAVRGGWPIGSPAFLDSLAATSGAAIRRPARGRPKSEI